MSSFAAASADESTRVTGKQKHMPWVEKYRPERVEDVSHQDEVIKTLKSAIDQGSVPHLLFYGPPGTGKTTTVLALARALYGPDLYKSRILELNASDERGISVVREKVKGFAQHSVGNQKANGYPCPRFKLIILDEADTMTPDAQSALRRIMEAYSKVTRFCLICNYVTRLIEPLASRCAKFRFKSLPVDSMMDRLNHIAASENVSLQPGCLDAIMNVSGGDMRKAVTYLQTCHQLSAGNAISLEDVVDISGHVPADVMGDLWASMKKGLFDGVKAAVDRLLSQGYPLLGVLHQLHDDVVVKADLTDIDKALICEKLGEAEKCLVDGAAEGLQMLDVAAFITRRYIGLQLA